MFKVKAFTRELWTALLILYSLVVFIFFLSSPYFFLGISNYLMVPFFLFVPGYSLVILLFRDIKIEEKVFLSICLSIALFIAIDGLLDTVRIQLIFPQAVLALLTILMLIGKWFRS